MQGFSALASSLSWKTADVDFSVFRQMTLDANRMASLPPVMEWRNSTDPENQRLRKTSAPYQRSLTRSQKCVRAGARSGN